MNVLIGAIAVLVLMLGAPSVQAFKGIAKDGYDAGSLRQKAGKPYPFGQNFTAKYKLGYDFGYRNGIQGAPYIR